MDSYINGKKQLQQALLDCLECDDENLLQLYQDISFIISQQKILENPYELTALLHLILNISNYHYRSPGFFDKIDKILTDLKDNIQQNYSNFEIFNLFKSNKRILLFLQKNGLLNFDQYIVKTITQKKYKNRFYPEYFYPEIKSFLDDETSREIEANINQITDNDTNLYESLRKSGENHHKICQLIRTDSIEDFITYINFNKIPISGTLQRSPFETNPILLKNEKVTLIEYASFYGSYQVVKYLYASNVSVDITIWCHSIHSGNPNLIHFLEDEVMKPDKSTFCLCFVEAIKCHQNDIIEYFLTNYVQNRPEDYDEAFTFCLKFYNYGYFPCNYNNNFVYDFLCRYGHTSIIDFLLNEKLIEMNPNSLIISMETF